jgi:hypothetical protein
MINLSKLTWFGYQFVLQYRTDPRINPRTDMEKLHSKRQLSVFFGS